MTKAVVHLEKASANSSQFHLLRTWGCIKEANGCRYCFDISILVIAPNSDSSWLYRLGVSQAQKAKESRDGRPRLRIS